MATPAASRPPPRPLCGACGSNFAKIAHWYDHPETDNVSVVHSTATIRVHENGNATWIVKDELASGETARFFRNNSWALHDIADRAGPGTLLDAHVAGPKTVVLRYRTTKATTAPGGVLRFDGFRNVHGGTVSSLGADKLTVVGPPGNVVTRAPAGAETSGNSFTLTKYHDPGDGPFVTFAGSGGVVGETWSFVAVAQALAGTVLQNLFVTVLLPCLLLLTLLVGFVRISADAVTRSNESLDKMTTVVGGIGSLGLVIGLAFADGSIRYVLVFLIAGGAYLALALAFRSGVRPTTVHTSVAVYGAGIVGFVLMVVIAAATDQYFFHRLLERNYYAVHAVLFAALISLLLLSLVVVGYVVTDGRYRRAAIAVPVLALGGVLLASSTLTQAPSPNGTLIFLVLGVIQLVIVVLAGFPAFLLGRTIPKGEGA